MLIDTAGCAFSTSSAHSLFCILLPAEAKQVAVALTEGLSLLCCQEHVVMRR